MVAMEATIESLKAIGNVRGVQVIEAELKKEKRKKFPSRGYAMLKRRTSS